VLVGTFFGLATSPVAQATFPGRNGEIVFSLSRSTGGGETDESCSTPTCSDQRLYALGPRGRSVRRIPTCGRLCDDSEAAVDRRGQRLVFERVQYTAPGTLENPVFLFGIANRDGSGAQTINQSGTVPTWAPSGERFAFEDRPTPRAPTEIYIYDERQGAAHRLTVREGWGPDWSARNRIAFSRPLFRAGHFVGRYGLYSIRPDGRARRLVTDVGTPVQPNWSPSGRYLVYTDLDRGREGIYTIRADGKHRRRLTKRSAMSPVWSPDGRRIAFVRSFRSILVMNRDGSRLHPLYTARRTGAQSPLGRISWAPRPR